MNERYIPGKNPAEQQESTDTLARQLVQKLNGGASLSVDVKKQLLDALNRPPAPVAAPTTPELKNPAAQPEAPRAEQERTDPIWKQFLNPISQKEIARLNENEKQYIEQASIALANQCLAFHVSQTKPLGVEMPPGTKEDYTSTDIRKGNFDFKRISREIDQLLTPPLRNVARAGTPERNIINVFDYARQPDIAVVGFSLKSPPNTVPNDSREIPSKYVLALKKDSFYNELLTGNGLRLMSFILQQAAIRMSPEKACFFDASLAGRDGLFAEGQNPWATLLFPQRKIISLEDSRDPRLKPTILQARNDEEFESRAKQIAKVSRVDRELDLQGNMPENKRVSLYKRKTT